MKWINQHQQYKTFWATTENAIRTSCGWQVNDGAAPILTARLRSGHAPNRPRASRASEGMDDEAVVTDLLAAAAEHARACLGREFMPAAYWVTLRAVPPATRGALHEFGGR